MSKEATILSIATQKGGSGKSTLTIIIATHLHSIGKKVLVIDADFQQTIIASRKLDTGEGFNLISLLDSNSIIEHLKKVISQYDYILIDTSGRLHGKDLTTAVMIADFVIVPIVASTFDIASTSSFLHTIEPAQKEYEFKVLGVINKKDRTLEHTILGELEGKAGLKMLDNGLNNRAAYKRLSTIEPVVNDEVELMFNELKKYING